jgi:hypothetical protein
LDLDFFCNLGSSFAVVITATEKEFVICNFTDKPILFGSGLSGLGPGKPGRWIYNGRGPEKQNQENQAKPP